jgi:hypothetical protein
VPTSSVANTTSAGGLTTGAKIGAGVGAVCGLAFIGFLLYFLTFLLKRQSQEKYNRWRVAQIQAKVGRTFGSENTANGSFDRVDSRGGAAGFQISRTATPNSIVESVRRPLPPLPPQYHSISSQESYAPYWQLSEPLAYELRNLDPHAIAQHTQLPSHYSFSGPPVTSPIDDPPRRMSPVQGPAATQLPSHYPFSGLPVTSPISPIDTVPPLRTTPVQEFAAAQLPSHISGSPVTSPISPIEGSNEPPPRMTPIQQHAAAQLPSYYSFQVPPVTSSASPIEDPSRRPIGIQEMAAAQLPSHYSFSGPPSGWVWPLDVPTRQLTPAQELASARLRSNMSPMGLAGMDD